MQLIPRSEAGEEEGSEVEGVIVVEGAVEEGMVQQIVAEEEGEEEGQEEGHPERGEEEVDIQIVVEEEGTAQQIVVGEEDTCHEEEVVIHRGEVWKQREIDCWLLTDHGGVSLTHLGLGLGSFFRR